VDDESVKRYALRLADDALVLGHRLSEWSSRGPYLEEDLALTNVALDYLGRARLFYGYAVKLSDDGSTEDSFAYLRGCREFTNHLIHELPVGDFAFTMTRQYLVDEFNQAFMESLLQSNDTTLVAIAGKVIKEGAYHIRRSHEWMLTLGDGTEESHERMQKAIEELWGYTFELFEMDRLDSLMASLGVGVDRASLYEPWLHRVSTTLNDSTLIQPTDDWRVTGGRRGVHTEFLDHMLSDLQFLQRTYPGQQW
jgi:ring-1,2-phenylacetyl-CoA epoxidase subunit PaaC